MSCLPVRQTSLRCPRTHANAHVHARAGVSARSRLHHSRTHGHARPHAHSKIRCAIIHEKQLRLLPHEEVYSTVPGVWNLSSEQGNLGTFVITNVRLVWFANCRWVQRVRPTCRCPSCATGVRRALRLACTSWRARVLTDCDAPPARTSRQESKFGMAIVVKTTKRSGSYTLGFSVTPAERLSSVFKEIEMLHATYSQVARASWRTILAALHARACDTAAADMAPHASDARARARGRAWLAHACRTPSLESS